MNGVGSYDFKTLYKLALHSPGDAALVCLATWVLTYQCVANEVEQPADSVTLKQLAFQ